MTPPVRVTDLDFPRPAASVATIPPPGGSLVRAGRASDRVAVFAGARSVARASGLAGILGIAGDGAALTGPVRLAAPPAANALITPRSLVRERIGAGGASKETLLVPERLPGAVVQWSGQAPEGGWTLEVELPVGLGTADETRVSIAGTLLRWAGPDAAGAILQIAGGATPAEWALFEGDGRTLARASVHPEPDAPVTLLVIRVDDPERLPSLSALAAVAAHRRRDDLEPDDAEGIVVTTGVFDIDEGVAWARASLRGLLVEHRGERSLRVPRADAPILARGALAAGELAVASAALDSSAPGLDDALARARWVAWTGRPGPLLDAREALSPILESAPLFVRHAVATAAEAVNEGDWAKELRGAPTGPARRTLPTLARTVRAEGTFEDPHATPDAAGLERALTDVRSDAPEWGLAVLRHTLGRFCTEGPGVGGLEAALALDLLMSGMLGAEADATFGRLTLAPCLPPAWTRFRIGGIHLGDAIVEMEMRRNGAHHWFALRQHAGGAPITWIFEPRLDGISLVEARVDGAVATIDAVAAGGRIQPRIQLPAERERVVEFTVRPRVEPSTSP